MSLIYNQHITILRAKQVTSPYTTETVENWDNPDVVIVDFPVSIQPRTTDEGPVERAITTDRWWMCTPPGRDLDLRVTDRVRMDSGTILEVAGSPIRWPHPWIPGHIHHVEANLEVTRG